MTKRLEILQASLEKKKAVVDAKVGNHFATVKEANGQPLNDKRGGRAVMQKWEQQNDAIRAAQEGIEVTKAAIEREQDKIAHCEAVKDDLPSVFIELINEGVITQWRKFPNRFFVVGVPVAKIIWNTKLKKLQYSHANELKNADEVAKFKSALALIQASLPKN